MALQLVVGAGHIGRVLAERLVARGDTVRVATRSGTTVDGCEALALDAGDRQALTAAATGASTLFLVTNPPYWTWSTEWPPIFAAAIEAARASGARLVIMGNLYAYGAARMPMREDSPLLTTETKGLARKAGWLAAEEAAEADATATAVTPLTVAEVRASDYFGPGVEGTNHLGRGFFTALRSSKTARVVGDPDAPHSWSYLPDIVTVLVAAADRPQPEPARVWHVPSTTRSVREIAAERNAADGTRGRVAPYGDLVLRIVGLFSPLIREVRASSYQFRSPFVIDSALTERELGVSASPWAEALGATAESYRR